MSKFIDIVTRLSRGETQPIGFIARQAASPRPKIQVVASLTAESAESLTGHIGGSDAALLRFSKPAAGAEALQKLSQSLPDIIWGGWLRGGDGDIEQIARAGGDFVVFSASAAPLTMLNSSKETGKILEIEESLSDGLLRAANHLPVDAVLVAGEEKESLALTWRRLMLFQHFADLLAKPLLVTVPSQVTAAELKTLWEAGAIAVVLEVSPKQPEDGLMKLRQEIDKLEFPSRRARRAEVLAPRLAQPTGRTTTEEDEEEEDE